MTCTWPDDHDSDCARCAVMRVCLDQVPHDMRLWCEQFGYQWAPAIDRRGHTIQHAFAEQVAARLLAWLRWPGHIGADPEAVRRVAVAAGVTEGEVRDLAVQTRQVFEGRARIHPLDGTPAGELRPCTTSRACFGCDGTGANTSLYEWQRDDDEIAEPMSEDCEECHGSGDGFDPDWPAVAKIAAYLDMTGPLLDFALAYDPGEGWQGTVPIELRRFTATDDDLAAAADIARAMGHPVDTAPNPEDTWLARQGEGWRWVHEFREQRQSIDLGQYRADEVDIVDPLPLWVDDTTDASIYAQRNLQVQVMDDDEVRETLDDETWPVTVNRNVR